MFSFSFCNRTSAQAPLAFLATSVENASVVFRGEIDFNASRCAAWRAPDNVLSCTSIASFLSTNDSTPPTCASYYRSTAAVVAFCASANATQSSVRLSNAACSGEALATTNCTRVVHEQLFVDDDVIVDVRAQTSSSLSSLSSSSNVTFVVAVARDWQFNGTFAELSCVQQPPPPSKATFVTACDLQFKKCFEECRRPTYFAVCFVCLLVSFFFVFLF